MTDFNFEQYTGHIPRGDTKIAINKTGLIRISSSFYRVTNVKNYKYVILFYDKINKAIAFKFTNKIEAGALKVTRDRTAGTISTTSFFKANNLNLRNYFGRYSWKKLALPNIGEVYIIELSKR